ncbi:MAG: hypothetical protein LBJ60_04715 [Tannerellaceae bacterium]|jgi:hypothetical protein|nr:hypothetical protein [Tannerellaceae bacterium]
MARLEKKKEANREQNLSFWKIRACLYPVINTGLAICPRISLANMGN